MLSRQSLVDVTDRLNPYVLFMHFHGEVTRDCSLSDVIPYKILFEKKEDGCADIIDQDSI